MCLAAIFTASACRRSADVPAVGVRRLKVVTTIFPLYDMARAIGGDRTEVTLLLPPGIEAHSFEPKPGDMARINEADLFVYTGKFMEPWAGDILGSVINKDLLAVDAGRGVKMMESAGHGRGGAPGAPDPHIWLDFDNAKVMAGNIAGALESRDPAGGGFYRRAAAAYNAKLDSLDSAYRTGLSSCRTKEIIYGGHYAFGYPARRYGLKYLAAQGLSPDSEPTARDLAALIGRVRKDGVKFIFYEELASPKIAETIAGETGARMLLLNAAHNIGRDQVERGVSFFDILQKNLDTLKTGLECEGKK
ncbi:MAG: zinc-binding protein [Elusimicrobia bacterium GWA2_56_46]|nr:MAG: zinc-binding protein [Elusimicrobia bacterium GWA2_56_46]OGR55035.1 MAG: zinc-binding protein [Elusimicrobia bacterium GWC2_56_31]